MKGSAGSVFVVPIERLILFKVNRGKFKKEKTLSRSRGPCDPTVRSFRSCRLAEQIYTFIVRRILSLSLIPKAKQFSRSMVVDIEVR